MQCTTDNDFKTAADKISSSGRFLQKAVQTYLIQVAARWMETGDARVAVVRTNMLLKSMPEGMRSNAVKAWVHEFFEFQWDKNAFSLGDRTKIDADRFKRLRDTLWHKFKKEPEFQPFDILAAFEKFAKRVEAAAADDRNADALPDEMLAAIDAAREVQKRLMEKRAAEESGL